MSRGMELYPGRACFKALWEERPHVADKFAPYRPTVWNIPSIRSLAGAEQIACGLRRVCAQTA
jgi:hypothetical protein